MRLMLVDIVAVHSCKFLQYIFFLLPSHIFLIVSLLYFIVYFLLNLRFHVFWNVFLFFQHTHSVQVIFLLIKTERIKPFFFCLLIIVLLNSLFLLYFFLCLLQFFINRLQHIFFLFLSFLFFFIGVNFEKLLRNIQ